MKSLSTPRCVLLPHARDDHRSPPSTYPVAFHTVGHVFHDLIPRAPIPGSHNPVSKHGTVASARRARLTPRTTRRAQRPDRADLARCPGREVMMPSSPHALARRGIPQEPRAVTRIPHDQRPASSP